MLMSLLNDAVFRVDRLEWRRRRQIAKRLLLRLRLTTGCRGDCVQACSGIGWLRRRLLLLIL